jgi:cytoskeletal protein CcmA (bactofilin family)
MWNRRKEEEPAIKPYTAPPRPAENAKEGIPMSTLPSRVPEPATETHRGSGALIGKSVVIKGQLFSREDLTIDGEVEGSVELPEHRLTVGPNGKVMAGITARELVVLGTIHGNVQTSDKLEIRKEAKLVGDIKTARVVIEDGAYFKGNIDIVRTEVQRGGAAAPKPQGQPQAVAPKPATPASGSGPAMAAGNEGSR